MLSNFTVVGVTGSDQNYHMIQANKYFRGRRNTNSRLEPATESKPENQAKDHGSLRPTLVLTTLLFLIIAPEPDSQDIAEMTANFIAPQNHPVLLASTERTGSVHRERR